jgi:hypothetical protein
MRVEREANWIGKCMGYMGFVIADAVYRIRSEGRGEGSFATAQTELRS